MPRRRYAKLVIIPAVIGLLGAVLMVGATIADHRATEDDVARWGMVAMLASIGLTVLIVVWRTREPADVMFRDGYDLGFQAGLKAGREEVRPTLRSIRGGREDNAAG